MFGLQNKKINAYPSKQQFNIIAPRLEKTGLCICENKDEEQLRGNSEADQCFVFATRIEQCLFFPKFEISSL